MFTICASQTFESNVALALELKARLYDVGVLEYIDFKSNTQSRYVQYLDESVVDKACPKHQLAVNCNYDGNVFTFTFRNNNILCGFLAVKNGQVDYYIATTELNQLLLVAMNSYFKMFLQKLQPYTIGSSKTTDFTMRLLKKLSASRYEIEGVSSSGDFRLNYVPTSILEHEVCKKYNLCLSTHLSLEITSEKNKIIIKFSNKTAKVSGTMIIKGGKVDSCKSEFAIDQSIFDAIKEYFKNI